MKRTISQYKARNAEPSSRKRTRTKELPLSWVTTTLGEVATIRGGKRLPKGKTYSNEPTEHAYIRVSDFKNGTVDLSSLRYISQEVYETISRYVISKDDVYISIAGTIGITGQVPPELHGANLTDNAAIIALSQEISPSYIHKLLTSPDLQDQIRSANITTAQPKLALFRIKALEIPIPPEAEQFRIVSAIESLQERMSRARVLLSEIKTLIDNYRHCMLQAAFTGRLTALWREHNTCVESGHELLLRIRAERKERWHTIQMAKFKTKGREAPKDLLRKYKEPKSADESRLPDLPKNWCWAAVAELTENHDSSRIPIKHADRTKRPSSYRYYGAFGVIDEIDDFIFDGNYLLLAEDGINPLKGQRPIAIVASGKFWVNNHAHVLTAFSGMPLEYLALFFNSPELNLAEHLSGDRRTKLTRGNMDRICVPLAPLSEQVEIVRLYKEAIEPVTSLLAEVESMESTLTVLEQSILSKAFEGQLVPQDPNDEPASEILARIHNICEQLKPIGKRTTPKTKGA